MLKQATLAVLILIILSIIWYFDDGPHYIRYDCSISEIHPDYPVEVKEHCRKMRAVII
jgi:hypothetical protein